MYSQRNGDSRPESPAGHIEEGPIAWVRNCLREAYPVPGGDTSAFGWNGARQNRSPVVKLPAQMTERAPVQVIEHRVPTSVAAAAADDTIHLTEISFAAGMPDVDRRAEDRREQERRADDRSKLSVYRAATLRWRDLEALCLIRNISPGGLMGILHKSLYEGARVTVEIRSGQYIPGRVVWSRDEMIGVRFDQRIDVMEVLQAPSTGEPGAIQRMPRLRIACAAALQLPSQTQRVNLVDVSQGGAKIEAEGLRVGDDVILTIRDLEPRRGTVRWVRGGRAGIAFLAAIPFDRLARWAVERQAESNPRAR